MQRKAAKARLRKPMADRFSQSVCGWNAQYFPVSLECVLSGLLLGPSYLIASADVDVSERNSFCF